MKLIQINSHATKLEDYAAIAVDARIKVVGRRRIGVRDIDGRPILEEWLSETDLLAYIPAWDPKDIHKLRDYAVFAPQGDFYPTPWFRRWMVEHNYPGHLTYAGKGCIHPDHYQELRVTCRRIREQIKKEFLISRHGLAWGWKDFKVM